MPAVLVVLAVLAAGCTGSPGAESPDPPAGTPAQTPAETPAETYGQTATPDAPRIAEGDRLRYVALGDSYTAGPLVPTTDLADGCLRSDHNYPSLLAARLDLDLEDVSCSGATTRDLVRRQPTFRDTSVPPQQRAVDRRTDLVTVGIGGNDLGLFSTLVQSCLGLRDLDPSGSPCADSDVGQGMLRGLGTIGDNVEQSLIRIRERAPQARVVLVGYLRIVPSTGSCSGRLPFAGGDVTFGDRVIRGLAGELEEAARAADVDYVDMYAASRGHDVCSAQPWVNGRESTPGVAAAFHPLLSGMRAVAGELGVLLAED